MATSNSVSIDSAMQIIAAGLTLMLLFCQPCLASAYADINSSGSGPGDSEAAKPLDIKAGASSNGAIEKGGGLTTGSSSVDSASRLKQTISAIRKMDTSADPIVLIDRLVLSKIISLQRLSANFRIESTKQDKWRSWRQTFYATANSGATASGLFYDVGQRTWNLEHNPRFAYALINGKFTVSKRYVGLPTHYIVPGLVPQYVGQFIGAGGSMFELAVNEKNDFQAAHQGFSPKETRLQVHVLQVEIDKLLQQRQAMVAARDSGARPVLEAEGKVLRDIRNLTLKQYVRYYADAKELRTQENVAYLMDIAKNIVGALGVIDGQYAAVHKSVPYLGVSGLLTFLSGVMIPLIPVTGRYAGKLRGLIATKSVEKSIDTKNDSDVRSYQTDCKMLEGLSARQLPDSDVPARSVVYQLEQAAFREETTENEIVKFGLKKAYNRNLLISGLTGGSKMTLGITNMVIGWGDVRNPRRADALSLAGQLTYGTGSVLTILNAVEGQMETQLKTKNLRRQGRLEGQILERRLVALDQMDTAIGAPTVPVPVTPSIQAPGLPVPNE